MKILLADVDSKIANLALMKASTFHRTRGDEVRLYRHRLPNGNFRRQIPVDVEADLAYVSCIFTWHRPIAEALIRHLRAVGMDVVHGGTGFDHGRDMSERVYMPDPIEYAPADYDLYGVDYAVGFCNRGCNRKCQFCDVPKKEGKIDPTRYRPPWTWIPEGFRKAMLLDNDVALYPDDQLEEILGWFISSGVKCSITQGWDIRATTPERAALLADLKPWDLKFSERALYIAWDYLGIEGWIRKNVPILQDAGFRGRSGRITCYILVGFDPKLEGTGRFGPSRVGDPAARESAMHRFRVLWEEFGVYPFAMKYDNRRDDPWMNAFARWCNRPGLFKKHTFEEYLQRKAPRLLTGTM